jgi:hypothetical protein
MVRTELRNIVENILDAKQITDADVTALSQDILAEGTITQEVIDVLVALDRAIVSPNSNWTAFLVATAVDFVVWTCRPTGVVTRDLAQWLVSTLSVGEGPTENAMRIAFEVVREAERCDEVLITFAMGKAGLKARQDLSRSGNALLVA